MPQPAQTIQPDDLDRAIDTAMAGLVELRHDLHAHPQLSYEETYASAAVRRELDAIGLPYQAGLAETGVVGWIEPGSAPPADTPAVALRADMDALPIAEQTGLSYASQHPGLMHACGHDGHTTILIGAARALSGLRDQLPRPVKLLFQPAEEGGAGAERMMRDGALDASVGGRKVESIFGLHGWPRLPVGELATKPGPLMAATDTFRITLVGRGGHAAAPHECRDPIPAAAQLVTALQTVVSRDVNPTEPAVLTVAQVHAGQGDAPNVIPDRAMLYGTIRTLSAETRAAIVDRVRELAEQAAAGLRGNAEIDLQPGYPMVSNDPDATDHAMRCARAVLGDDRVHTMDFPVLGGEDFAYYSQAVPACFSFIGLCPSDQNDYPMLHSAQFDFNDDALRVGIKLMCAWVLMRN